MPPMEIWSCDSLPKDFECFKYGSHYNVFNSNPKLTTDFTEYPLRGCVNKVLSNSSLLFSVKNNHSSAAAS